MKASIVVGLQFGDEGKGITTDHLCSQDPENSIVVRFSGGQQAGHTVIYNGIKHVHSNFGSGTLRGVPTYFSEYCSIYPNTIWREKKVLIEKGIEPMLIVHPLAKVTTPFDVAFGRIRELSLKHGSCGLGIGTTMQRHNNTGYKLFAVDLACPKILTEKLRNINEYYASKINNKSEYSLYNEIAMEELEKFKSALRHDLFKYSGYEILLNYTHTIFEGSQGILLDMNHGIFPNVTHAETTSKNAFEICNKLAIPFPEVYYVTRCYQTRHGNGYMSNETPIALINNEEEINVSNKWQGDFRTGELDYDLLNYALAVDDNNLRSRNKYLVVTCLDQRPVFSLEPDKINFNFKNILLSDSPISGESNFKPLYKTLQL